MFQFEYVVAVWNMEGPMLEGYQEGELVVDEE